MALFGDLFGAIYQAQQSGGSLKDKLDTIIPVAKQEADNLKKVTDQVKDVYQEIRNVINAPDLNTASTSAKNASDKWDKYFEDYYVQQAIKQNPDKYAGYPNLSEEQKAELAKDVQVIRTNFEGKVKDTIGEKLYEIGSKIKNEADDVIANIDKHAANIQKIASQIEKGSKKVVEKIEKIANKAQKVFGKLFHNNSNDQASKSVLINDLANFGLSRAGMLTTAVGGAATGVSAMVAAFRTGDIKGGIGAAKSSISSIRATWQATDQKRDDFFKEKEKLQEQIADGRHLGIGHKPRNFIEDPEKKKPEKGDHKQDNSEEEPTNKEKSKTDAQQDGDKKDGPEFVSEMKFVLDGTPGNGNSECLIDGDEYEISDCHISQSLLSPMKYSFSLIKKGIAEESEKDVKYNVCKQIIGRDIDLLVKTKSSESGADASTFRFKGLVTGVNSSRGIGGAQSFYVTASSYDYLLNAAPNCRSFENKTLEEIVTAVTSGIPNLETSINPRLKSKIPYIVQFNQTDYEFLAMLAQRFGEWMYSDGVKFVFGMIESPNADVVKMRYPGGNIFSHGASLQLRDLNIMHVAPDLYSFDNDGIKKKTSKEAASRNLHELNEAVCQRVNKLYPKTNIYYPHVGGAFDDGESEGSMELIENSIKVETRGMKAQLYTSDGSSKVAKLFIGQHFEVEDGIEKTSSIDKQDLLQHPLMIIGSEHSFILNQNYENSFEAIPINCDYPPYGNADIICQAFTQRAKVVDNQDPKALGRVRVQFPWQEIQSDEEEEMKTPWIRIVQAYGGFSKGAQFIPEIGEEVMIGFEMSNVERPFVMGTLFNGTASPDGDWAARVAEGTANNIKAIRTRNGHTLMFNDEGDGGDIQIFDYEKNTYLIHLSTDGKFVHIEAEGDIKLTAGNDIGIKAEKNISIEAGENISMSSGKDTDINADANMSLSAEVNMQQQATAIYAEAKDTISQESGKTHVIKTSTLKEKSSSKTSIDGGGLVEITASSVKVR